MLTTNTLRRQQLIALSVALVYAAVLAALPLTAFMDRVNYLRYLERAAYIFTYYKGFTVLSNEPLWLTVNLFLGAALPHDIALRLIIFISSGVTSHAVLSRRSGVSFLLALGLLCVPFMLTNHVIHLRQGFALAIFAIGYSLGGPRRWSVWLLTPFIHVGFAIVLVAITSRLLLSKVVKLSFRASLVSHLALMVLVGAGVLFTAQLAGARQIQIYELGGGGSGVGFLFWVIIYALFLSYREGCTEDEQIGLAIIAFYIGAYWTFPPAARVLEGMFPFIILAVTRRSAFPSRAAAILILLFGAIGMLANIEKPYLGFGIPDHEQHLNSR